MNPAQAQYAEYQSNLPHTGLNLTLIAVISIVFIAVGVLAYLKGER